MNIYYDDLYPDVKQAVLKFLKIKDPTELNLDVIPLFNLERADIDDERQGFINDAFRQGGETQDEKFGY